MTKRKKSTVGSEQLGGDDYYDEDNNEDYEDRKVNKKKGHQQNGHGRSVSNGYDHHHIREVNVSQVNLYFITYSLF